MERPVLALLLVLLLCATTAWHKGGWCRLSASSWQQGRSCEPSHGVPLACATEAGVLLRCTHGLTSARFLARFRPVWPPMVGRMASGRS